MGAYNRTTLYNPIGAIVRPPPEWVINLAINGKTIKETCSCGASTERLAAWAWTTSGLLDPFNVWRADHACPDRPASPEAPSSNDTPLTVDAGDPADAIGFRLLGEDEP